MSSRLKAKITRTPVAQRNSRGVSAPPNRANSKPRRIFLLSPANAAGQRARMILSDRAQFDMAIRLRREGPNFQSSHALRKVVRKAESLMEAVIFVGVQGAGKSTFYQQKFFDTHVRISLDVLRTRHRERILFEACLAARQSFVIDNTNPLPADRARYMAPARTAGFRLSAYFFQTELRDAIRRNAQRKLKKRIPTIAVAGTFKKVQRPLIAEGFDEIHTVSIGEGNQFIVI